MKRASALLLLIFVGAVVSVSAQTVHKSAAGLDCSGCHIMHGTDGAGTTVGPYDTLLSEASIENLCLSCHDTNGSRYSSYSSVVPAVMNASGLPAAGDFAALVAGDASATANAGNGHNLGAVSLSLTPAGSPAAVTGFTCTSCHDAHGVETSTGTVSAYRNLLGIPKGSGSSTSIIVEASSTNLLTGDVFELAGNRYGESGPSGGLSGFSGWCASCHDGFYGDSNTGSASPFRRHPTSNGTTVYNVTAAYLAVSPATARYPAEDTTASSTANIGPYGNDANDSIFCLSCHNAHASPNSDALRWNYAQQAQTSPDSACQQCHDK